MLETITERDYHAKYKQALIRLGVDRTALSQWRRRHRHGDLTSKDEREFGCYGYEDQTVEPIDIEDDDDTELLHELQECLALFRLTSGTEATVSELLGYIKQVQSRNYR